MRKESSISSVEVLFDGMKDFELKILKQNWIDNDPNNDTDLCSHGQFYLRVRSQVILNEADLDLTVSTSTLLLLRTLFDDYDRDDEYPLILHCGMLLMLTCPISVTWRLRHKENSVFIDKLRKSPTVNVDDRIEFPDASVQLDLREYAVPILRCADDVADFFQKAKERNFDNDYDKNDYGIFWEEFTKLRSRASKIIKP